MPFTFASSPLSESLEQAILNTKGALRASIAFFNLAPAVVSFLLCLATLSRMLENSERANACTRYRHQRNKVYLKQNARNTLFSFSVEVNHILDGRLALPRQALIDGSHVISVEMHSKDKKNAGAP